VVDPEAETLKALGAPAVYATADFSPDGSFLLVEYLVGPWSHAVPWWRFASELEVWDTNGKPVATVASLPLADEVPIHGVPVGPRGPSWRATAPHQLYWVEALERPSTGSSTGRTAGAPMTAPSCSSSTSASGAGPTPGSWTWTRVPRACGSTST